MLRENEVSSIIQILKSLKVRYKRCKIHLILPQRESKSVRYIRKFVISEFVITVKFYKDLLRIVPENQKKTSLYP